ncbi:unnamed protein product [Mycena citricolor]|uniref:Carboxylic ester hydrolase n=1 Tax=Mycena citricolor TaxID=2018698 RepID=A0AAD2Q0X2_9AGAR|nr:unnamed protein product [Mycena citricolor]
MLESLFFLFIALAAGAIAAPAAQIPLTTVILDCEHHTGKSLPAQLISSGAVDATFTGRANETTGLTYFLGMRFADAPVGDLRWRAPVSPPSTPLGSVNATAYGSACIGASQPNAGATTSEDCLSTNVYLPTNGTTPTSKLPVLVFMYGGGFESGRSSKFPPEDLLPASAQPLILVTFNYRVGQFGFLAGTPVHDEGVINVGLLDQQAALKWVQRYISLFGGDPTRVTLWGQSAGAGSLLYHVSGFFSGFSDEYLADRVKMIAQGGTANEGLFSQVIGDSPPTLYLPSYDDPHVTTLFNTFNSLAGCDDDGDDSASIMDCLRGASTATIASAGASTLDALPDALFPLVPILDGVYLTQRTYDALSSGSFMRVPAIFGSNTNEGARWSADLTDPGANTSSPNADEDTVFAFLVGQYPTLTQDTFVAAVSQHYPLSAFAGNVSLQGQQMYGELRYICTSVLGARSAAVQGLPAYGYRYNNPLRGSNHGDELDSFFLTPPTVDAADAALVSNMRQYWTSFATTGTPSAAGAPVWTTFDVPAIPSGARILLQPGGVSMEAVDSGLLDRCAFWASVKDELSI